MTVLTNLLIVEFVNPIDTSVFGTIHLDMYVHRNRSMVTYNASGVYSAQALNKYNAEFINNSTVTNDFVKVSKVEVDKESALVTELADSANSRYMYMVQNIVDPVYTGSASWQTTTLTFNEGYNYAVVWRDGKQEVVKLVNNQYKVTQHPGQAVYVIPFSV